MEKLALGPGVATVFLGLLVFFVVYIAALSIWAHVKAEKLFGTVRERKVEHDMERVREWTRAVSLRYAAGWAVFAWGTVTLGFAQEGVAFTDGRLALIGMWLVSPALIYSMAGVYWRYWARTGVPRRET